MSVYNIKATPIAARDATPAALTNPETGKGFLKAVIGRERTSPEGISKGAAASQIRLISVPSNARLHSLEYALEALGTSALNVTAWYPTRIPQGAQNSPAASLNAVTVSSSLFVTSLSGVDTLSAWTNAFAAGSPTLVQMGQPLWQMLGLTSDPEVNMDLGFSVVTAVTTNGYVGLKATYVD